MTPSIVNSEPTQELPKQFRNYQNTPERIVNFYKLNHTVQTLSLVLSKKKYYLDQLSESRHERKMGVWEQLVRLNSLVDESDPDTELSQIQHAYQVCRIGNEYEFLIYYRVPKKLD